MSQLQFLMVTTLLLACGFAVAVPCDAASEFVRVHSKAADADFLVSCDAGPFTTDYAAQTASGVPLTAPYAVARGADKGLVRLMDEGGRRVQRYSIPHHRIRAIISVRVDQAMPDRLDLVFTARDLVALHTSTSNAGIFTENDVYRLAYRPGDIVDRRTFGANQELTEMLAAGLSVYDAARATCRASSKPRVPR